MTAIQHARLADVSVLRRVVDDVWQRGDLDAIGELYHEGYVGHDPFRALPLCGHTELRRHVTEVRNAFPDLRLEVEDVVIAGDRLAHRCVVRATHAGALGELPPTGRKVTVSGIEIMRFGPGGRILEQWMCWDLLGLLRQVGVLEINPWP